MSKEQELSILQVAVDTILSDSKIEYSEIKFFKIIRSNMKVVSDAEILEGVRGIDESFIEKDIREIPKGVNAKLILRHSLRHCSQRLHCYIPPMRCMPTFQLIDP